MVGPLGLQKNGGVEGRKEGRERVEGMEIRKGLGTGRGKEGGVRGMKEGKGGGRGRREEVSLHVFLSSLARPTPWELKH